MMAARIAVLSLVGAALVVSLASHALAAWVGRRAAAPAFLTRDCRGRAGRARCLLRGLLTSLGSQFVTGLLYPLGPLAGWLARRSCRRRTGPTVVCLHGLYHNPAAFLALRPALARRGLRRVLYPGYRSFGTDFERVAQKLLAGLRAGPPGPLLFVGHSLGGVLARRLMAEPDIARRTLAAVTLGSPHGGSALAVCAPGRLGRALVPGGPIVMAVEALPDPPGAALLSLASPADNMVAPLTGLCIGRPGWREEATPAVSHVAMLYHPAVIARAADFLARAVSERPGNPGAGPVSVADVTPSGL